MRGGAQPSTMIGDIDDVDAFGGTLLIGTMSPGGGIPSRSSSTYAVTPNCDTMAPEETPADDTIGEDDDFIGSLVDPSNLQPDQERSVGKSRFTSFGGAESLELRWESLKVSSHQKVLRGRHRKGHILNGVNGVARSNELTCILGPSGCGKTTLLNVLAGRLSGGRHGSVDITGRVSIAGRQVNPRQFRSRIAYVMQKDEMFATATPREALEFSAALRLDQPQGAAKLIDELLGALGLLKCSDTYIGNSVISGISGGQRKRTAIGVELITKPNIVCLDEPTSGLDSFAAYQVMRVLKDLARAGCTVISTLHQPSSEIFALMDRVICLCDGHSFYEGSRENMVQYLARAGYRCPVGFNPADYVIFLMQSDPRERVDKLLALWQQERKRVALLEEGGASLGSICEGRASSQLCATPLPTAPALLPGSALGYVPHKSFVRQLSQLFQRELRSAVRDRTTLGVRFALSVMLAFLFGIVFRRVGRSIEEETEASILDMLWTGLSPEETAALRKQKLEWHFNAIIQVAMVSMFSASQPTILAFPLERPVFLREHSSGTYDVLPYYLSKILLEVPLVFVQSLLTLSLCYITMELQGNFGYLLGIVVLLSTCSVSVALAIGCMVRFPRETGAVGPLVFVPQMLFSGVFVPVGLIPRYLRWGQYLCFLQYAIKVLGIVEFQKVRHRQVLFESQDIHVEDIFLYIFILVLIIFFFSGVGLLMLRHRTRHLF